MRLGVNVQIEYLLAGPTQTLLIVEAANNGDQHIAHDSLVVSGAGPLFNMEGEEGIGRRTWFEAQDNILGVTYEAQIEVNRQLEPICELSAHPPNELSPEVAAYLFPSRYCESDTFLDFVADQFGHAYGGEQIMEMAEWIFNNIQYTLGASVGTTTAADTFHHGQGVCRDFAHLMITFARAAGIPARMVSVYAPRIEPPDFHAVVEIWLEGGWRLLDPTRMASPTEMARIAVGRDAVDISFLTFFGSAELRQQSVSAVVL